MMNDVAYANRYFQTLRHGVKSVLGMPARSALKPAGGRVCKAPLPYQRQRLKPCFRDANAERMRTRWRARMQSALALPKAEAETPLSGR
jgi:hypothetical protein